MKNIKDALKMVGVCAITGATAMTGFVLGVLAFAPECVHVVNNKKENEESK